MIIHFDFTNKKVISVIDNADNANDGKKATHARFYALLNQMAYADKETIVYDASGGKTTSLSEFYETDRAGYERMLNDMQRAIGSPLNPPQGDLKTNSTIKKLRSGVLNRMQKYGIDTTNWDKVNDFLLQPRIAGKILPGMDESELRQLTKKLNAILQKKSLNK